MTVINKLSRLIGPILPENIKGQYISKSQRLFLEVGLTRFNDGFGTLSPFLVRSLRKLERLVRKEMEDLSALEVVLPTLTQTKLLEISGRNNLPDLFKLANDHEKNYVLSPTYEEGMTNLLASVRTLSQSQLPCRLYQISNKFRDEKRAKSGLLRSKEFLMKDLYCFDSSKETSERCYDEVVDKYHSFFQMLKVPYVCAKGSPGDMGGSMSHEFHFLADAGEDKIILCQDCGHAENLNCNQTNKESNCPKCQSKNVEVEYGIEVGHTFNLGTTYTKPFKATFLNKDGESELVHMNCFGLGLTRILAASVEVLCEAEEIRWPVQLAPYLVSVIFPKAGSKEEEAAGTKSELIYRNLAECLPEEVIVDDRTTMTIGKRLLANKKLGFPFVVVIGKNICDEVPHVEIHDVNADSFDLIQISDINQFILDKLLNKPESDEVLGQKNARS